MTSLSNFGDPMDTGSWLQNADHLAWLRAQAFQQFEFFQGSLNTAGGFHVLDHHGAPLATNIQELHTTTRMVHSYALGKQMGVKGAEDIIDQGMAYLWSHHRDTTHGGYLWALDGDTPHDTRKLAYGHVFVLLAGASAKIVGHPDADRLMQDVWAILNDKYWEPEHGLFCDEFNQDWTPFSTYRGMNANMHGVEALLTAFEATGETDFLNRAGQILDFFIARMAPQYDWRIPEHYDSDWSVDASYSGDPMFRPAGSTPGHSFEMSRLMLQHWSLSGCPDNDAVDQARRLFDQALLDAWDPIKQGFVYTLHLDGTWDNKLRLWWPVTEAIGALAAFMKIKHTQRDEHWYRRLWMFSNDHYIDHRNGSWFPELDMNDQPTDTQFQGKPDIYHALQAQVFPLTPKLSNIAAALGEKT